MMNKYLSPLNIPSQTRDGFAVLQEKSPPGRVFQLNSTRTAMNDGMRLYAGLYGMWDWDKGWSHFTKMV